MRKGKRRHKGLRQHTIYGLAVLLFGASLPFTALTHAASNIDTGGTGSQPSWADPKAIAVRQTGYMGSSQREPNFLNNLDCRLVTYRMTNNNSEQSGCFSEADFGLVDTDSDRVIFNGTDEAVQLLPFSPREVLVPWPGTIDVLALDAANTGGSYVHLYRDLLDSFQDQRNALGQLTGKQLNRAPETRLDDPSGQPLVINSQTMAFSNSGSWLVMEDLSGSFARVNLATLDLLPFAPSYAMLGSPALLKSQVAVSDSGQYVAIENDASATFKAYDLTTCSGPVQNLQPENCRSYDYWPYVRQHIPGLQTVRHVRFLNDGLLSFEVIVNGADAGSFVLAPADSITSLTNYIGLGDSYTSGEGAFDYLGNTDTPDNMCHLSAGSYPLLLARDAPSAAGGHSVACSGAVINDIGSTSPDYRGQARGTPSFKQLQATNPHFLASIETNYLPGYIAQNRFVSRQQPAVVTVSVGGDDIGFGDILTQCIAPHLSVHASDQTCFNTYEDRLELLQGIDRSITRWTALYKQLRGESPDSRIYVIGYPEIADDTGKCAINVHLSKSELEFSDELIIYLNKAIEGAAAKAGVAYVDISQALAGHRLCEAPSYDVAMNGLTAGTDAGLLGLKVFGKESYHPNALGQILIEQAILRQTHNLTTGTSTDTTSEADNQEKLLNAPKSGRKVTVRSADDTITSPIVYRGKSTPLAVAGVKHGLQPEKAYTIRLDGPNGPVTATTISDKDGNIATDVPIPPGTNPGGHTIDLTGENQAGEPIDVTQPIYVPNDNEDADGDDIPDANDSCQRASNSGQDADHDGIDDACDGFIGLPPAGGSQGNGSNRMENILQGSNDETGQPGTPAAINSRGQLTMSVPPTHVNPLSDKILQASENPFPELNLNLPVSAKGHVLAAKRLNRRAVDWQLWLLLPGILLFLLLLLCLGLAHKRIRAKYKNAYA